MIHNTFFYKNRGKILKKSIKNDKILISRFGGDEVKNFLSVDIKGFYRVQIIQY